ncbi:cysteine proteinase, partial [Trifolium medium]|nr:cysteine proteinase [Trifolium medium]
MNKVAGKNYTLGHNDFSDLTIEELTSSCMGIMDITSELASSKTVFFNMSVDDIPQSVDWRDQGAVTSVKYQYPC